ncbi:MAG: VWA domain-containing protein [Omnitrophica WOR_2 bacterium]
MPEDLNYYVILGLPRDASQEEIKRAYREAALRFHPDRNVKAGETEFFLKVQEAYEVVSDADKRAEYDATLPEEAPLPVEISLLYSRAFIQRLQEPQLLYLLFDFHLKGKLETISAPPINVCLVVDCSTSMKGEFMDVVKDTAIEITRQMRPIDSFSLVAFNDTAKVVLPAGSHTDRSAVESSIRMLLTGGGTEIYKGLQAGFTEVQRNYRKDYPSHIILLTDGYTYGDENDCFQLAEMARNDSIGISAIGIGNKWNDAFLESLTKRTGGIVNYVTRPKEIKQFITEKILILGKNVADNVSLSFNTGPDVKINYAFRLHPEAAILDIQSPIQLGYIPFESRLNILLELQINSVPENADIYDIARGQLILETPALQPTHSIKRLNFNRPITNEPDNTPPPAPVVQALSRVTLYRMQDKAQDDMKSGNPQAAAKCLQQLATHLFARGERDLAQTIQEEADHIQSRHAYSEEGHKRIKYGTRALALYSSPEASGSNTTHHTVDKPEREG